MNQTSAALPRGENEFLFAGLTMAPCRLVGAPRVAEAHASLECVVADAIALKNRHGDAIDRYLVLGEVIGVHIDDRLVHDGRFDIAAARSIARCGYQDYAVVESVFALARPRRMSAAPGGQAPRDEKRTVIAVYLMAPGFYAGLVGGPPG